MREIRQNAHFHLTKMRAFDIINRTNNYHFDGTEKIYLLQNKTNMDICNDNHVYSDLGQN